MQTCVAALRLPGRMAVEQVAGCAWNTWPDKRGMNGRMAWNPQLWRLMHVVAHHGSPSP